MKIMARTIVQIVLAVILIFLGWVVGRAQTSAPTFELVVDAPGGATTIECVEGCKLAWVERGVNANADFLISMHGTRCSSGRVGGWLSH